MNTATNQTNSLELRIKELEEENLLLKEKVNFLTHKLYGRSTEKASVLGIEGQMSLFNEAEVSQDKNAKEPGMKDVAGYRRRKYKGQREALLKDIPHEKKLCTLVPEDKFCETCGTQLVSVGEEFVRTEIEFIPAKVRVIDYYRETFECRNCRKNGLEYMEKSPMPYPVIQHSYASPSTIAWVMHQKYELAVPLYRQEKEWENLGVKLSRATMSNWITTSYRDWLSPVCELLKDELLKQNYIHADETRVRVMKEPERKNTTDSFMWVYASIKDSEKPVRIFNYCAGRSGNFAKKFLGNYSGYVHTDAYAGYGKVPNITRCYCWIHLRRYFVDALEKGVDNPGETIPAIAIKKIGGIFDADKLLNELSAEERYIQRLEKVKPLIEAFWSWVDSVPQNKIISSKLKKAFLYASNHRTEFMNFLKDGNCSLSNNLAENSIRPFTIGRKNWLFSGSPRGAEASAGVYTLIETAKANGLNPRKYIEYILGDIPGAAFKENPEFLEDYLPWNPMVQELCK